jgi:hypothetical protein
MSTKSTIATVLILTLLTLHVSITPTPAVVDNANAQTPVPELVTQLNQTSLSTNQSYPAHLDLYALNTDGTVEGPQDTSSIEAAWLWAGGSGGNPVQCWDYENKTWSRIDSQGSSDAIADKCNALDPSRSALGCPSDPESGRACDSDLRIPKAWPDETELDDESDDELEIKLAVWGYQVNIADLTDDRELAASQDVTLINGSQPEALTASDFGISIDGYTGSDLAQVVGFALFMTWALSRGLFLAGLVSLPPIIDPLLSAGPNHPFGFTFGIVAVALALLVEFVARNAGDGILGVFVPTEGRR